MVVELLRGGAGCRLLTDFAADRAPLLLIYALPKVFVFDGAFANAFVAPTRAAFGTLYGVVERERGSADDAGVELRGA